MEDQGQQLNLSVPEDQIPGQYANVVGVWHTPHDFAIDFCVVMPFAPGGPAARVVSRVRIPPTIVFDLLQTLNQNLAEYEETFGEIKRPEPNNPPQDEQEEGEQ
jgi:hypothetical protein